MVLEGTDQLDMSRQNSVVTHHRTYCRLGIASERLVIQFWVLQLIG